MIDESEGKKEPVPVENTSLAETEIKQGNQTKKAQPMDGVCGGGKDKDVKMIIVETKMSWNCYKMLNLLSHSNAQEPAIRV